MLGSGPSRDYGAPVSTGPILTGPLAEDRLRLEARLLHRATMAFKWTRLLGSNAVVALEVAGNFQPSQSRRSVANRQYRDHRLGGMEVITKGLERDNIRFGSDLR